MKFHLAQVNIAFAKYDYEDPAFAGFVDNLDRIYALAEATPGFVWRHISVDGDPEAKKIYASDDIIFNMSVWESYQAMHDFVFKTDHSGYLRRRREWFRRPDQPMTVLWWIPAGEIPALDEAYGRLKHLREHGPSAHAWTLATPHPPPGTDVQASAVE